MQKIGLFLFLTFSLTSYCQTFDAVEKGYYFVFVNDTIVSQHIKPNKAVLKALEKKAEYPQYDVYVKQPNIEIDLDVDKLLQLIQPETTNDTLNLGTTVLEPLPNNPILESVILENNVYKFKIRMSEGSEMPEGGFDLFIDGNDQNNHNDGVDSALEFIFQGLDTSVQHCFLVEARYTQVYPYVFNLSNEMCYPPKEMAIEVIDNLVLEDFNDFEVVLTSKNLDTIAECKQKEIINIVGIENYDGFFMRYKSPSYEGLVQKMKVVNGQLSNAYVSN